MPDLSPEVERAASRFDEWQIANTLQPQIITPSPQFQLSNSLRPLVLTLALNATILTRFDARQAALRGRVQRLQNTLHEEPANASASACHGIAVRELSRHRLVVPEHCLLYKAACTATQLACCQMAYAGAENSRLLGGLH